MKPGNRDRLTEYCTGLSAVRKGKMMLDAGQKRGIGFFGFETMTKGDMKMKSHVLPYATIRRKSPPSPPLYELPSPLPRI